MIIKYFSDTEAQLLKASADGIKTKPKWAKHSVHTSRRKGWDRKSNAQGGLA